jgi:hypothetical protein
VIILPGNDAPSRNMYTYNSVKVDAIRKPRQAKASNSIVRTNGHFLPKISDKYPTGTIEQANRTPIK